MEIKWIKTGAKAGQNRGKFDQELAKNGPKKDQKRTKNGLRMEEKIQPD